MKCDAVGMIDDVGEEIQWKFSGLFLCLLEGRRWLVIYI